MPLMRDTRGRESRTLVFVTLSWGALWLKFLAAGIGPIPPMTATEFGTAAAFVLAIWLGREWTDKVAAGGASG